MTISDPNWLGVASKLAVKAVVCVGNERLDQAPTVVLICGPVWVRPVSDRLAALPAPSAIVAPLRLTAVTARSAVFCPAATV